MAYQTVKFARRGPVGLLTLDRPERRNAIDARMIDEIHAVLDDVEAEAEVRVLVVDGAGPSFCAGFDLKESAAEGPRDVAAWRATLERDFAVIMRFWDFAKPTVAAVHGHAVAGGCELALACDITIADEDALFGEPELRFGSGIVALLLPWLTGPKQAKELLLTGNDRVSAERALTLGLINRIVPAGGAREAAVALARDIAVMEPEKVARVKQAVNRTYEHMGMREALRTGLDLDVEIESLETPDGRTFRDILRRDGLRAALAWRDGRFGEV